MTRTAIRYTLSALAAAALLSALAGSRVAAQHNVNLVYSVIARESPASAQSYPGAITNRFNENKANNAPESPKGLTTKKGSQAARPYRWRLP